MILKIKYPAFPPMYFSDLIKIDAFANKHNLNIVIQTATRGWSYVVHLYYSKQHKNYIAHGKQSKNYTCHGNNFSYSLEDILAVIEKDLCQLN